MMRRTIGLLVALAVVACGRTDMRVGADRPTVATSADMLSHDYAPDGRLAVAKYVAGKVAIYVMGADSSNAKRVSFGVWDWNGLWSPDGKWIAVDRDLGGNGDVAIVPSDSGAERMVAGTGANELIGDWLPDASGLVFLRTGDKGNAAWLYLMADGSSTKLFDVDGSVVYATPSPDGRGIAYSLAKDGKSTLWFWDRATRKHRQLTMEGFEAIAPKCFSPDGRSILYESRRTGTLDLWRLEVATGERSQLTQDVADDASGAWSSDGSRIVFTSNRGGQPDVWILTTGEGDVQRVTDDAIAEADPAWSPDGRSIVAVVRPGHTHLVSFPISGGPHVALTSGDWNVDLAYVVSPDGSQVAFAANKNGDYDIWTIPAAGGEPKLVSGAPGFDGLPSWSPDGTRIAFTSVRSGNRDVWITAADGSGSATQLTNWPTDEGTPQWSPDGETILFRSERESPGADLWTVPVAGGAPKRITRVGSVDLTFRWSPDSKLIAFSAHSTAAGGPVVFTIPAGGGVPQAWTRPTAFNPLWSPDGRQIAVSQCGAGYCATEVRGLDGSGVTRLNPDSVVYELGMSWSSDGSQLLIPSQNLSGDGSYGISLRPVSVGAGRMLPVPTGMTAARVRFARGDSVAIAILSPNSVLLQRIAVPAPTKIP